ncbi:RcpC/CpaB family pilus assembly protein [Streptomyces sp. NPDC059894]|uniref:RcpC/CpaB family pilus assembly protein n=1 Tax=unclassified Streptomyces TaxID=2593676 RepID=UPI00365EB5C9
MSLSSSPSAPCPPGAEAPATCEVPQFAPVRVRGGRYRLRRIVGSRRRALALGLAATAAALVAAVPGDAHDRARGHPDRDAPARARSSTGALQSPADDSLPSADGPVGRRPAGEVVEAPVRISDAATVRLLRPGDRVDVIATERTATAGGARVEARVVARRALVTRVPEPDAADGSAAGPGVGAGVVDGGGGGALVVLSVPRPTAARLVGAGATAGLAVTLW